MAEYILVHGIRVAKSWAPETFGRLTTIGPKFWVSVKSGLRYQRKAYQVCQCSCGTIICTRCNDLGKAKSTNCGCVRSSVMFAYNYKHGHSVSCNISAEYSSWTNMISRCLNPQIPNYHNYGGRGIRVCDRWQGDRGFQNFLEDMGPRPEGMSIDRIDVNGDYCPENCRWATDREQANNRRSNRLVTAFGRTQTLAQWKNCSVVSLATLCRRLDQGWAPEEALTIPAYTR